MNHQEIKAKSGLVLKELSQNELETVVGGYSHLARFGRGVSTIPEMLYATVTSKDFHGRPHDRSEGAMLALGIGTFVAVFEAACYGLYKGGCWALGKAKARINKKPANKPLDNKQSDVNENNVNKNLV